MILITRKERFYTKREAARWLETNGFHKRHELWVSDRESARIESLPATNRYVVLIGVTDQVE